MHGLLYMLGEGGADTGRTQKMVTVSLSLYKHPAQQTELLKPGGGAPLGPHPTELQRASRGCGKGGREREGAKGRGEGRGGRGWRREEWEGWG